MDGNLKKKPPDFVNVYKRPPVPQHWHVWWLLHTSILATNAWTIWGCEFGEKPLDLWWNQPEVHGWQFYKKALRLCECLQKTTWTSTKSIRTLLMAILWKKTWSLAKPICTRRTSNSQKTSLMCIRDGFNPLAHLHTAYTTALTPIMTATYKLSRYESMDDP